MNILDVSHKLMKTIFAFGFVILPLVACAQTPQKGDDNSDHGKKMGRISDFQFSIATTKDGSSVPVVRTKDGKVLKGKVLDKSNSMGIHASSIEEIETITIVRAIGSDYIIVYIGNRPHQFFIQHN